MRKLIAILRVVYMRRGVICEPLHYLHSIVCVAQRTVAHSFFIPSIISSVFYFFLNFLGLEFLSHAIL